RNVTGVQTCALPICRGQLGGQVTGEADGGLVRRRVHGEATQLLQRRVAPSGLVEGGEQPGDADVLRAGPVAWLELVLLVVDLLLDGGADGVRAELVVG